MLQERLLNMRGSAEDNGGIIIALLFKRQPFTTCEIGFVVPGVEQAGQISRVGIYKMRSAGSAGIKHGLHLEGKVIVLAFDSELAKSVHL